MLGLMVLGACTSGTDTGNPNQTLTLLNAEGEEIDCRAGTSVGSADDTQCEEQWDGCDDGRAYSVVCQADGTTDAGDASGAAMTCDCTVDGEPADTFTRSGDCSGQVDPLLIECDYNAGMSPQAYQQEEGLYVDSQVALDADCFPTDLDKTVSSGLYDIASRHDDSAEGAPCTRSYTANLRLNSLLQETVLVQGVEVTMRALDGTPLRFGREPNPYVTVVTGSVEPPSGQGPSREAIAVELIPGPYTEYLEPFDGQQLVAHAVVRGETLSGRAVEVRPFQYPITICLGCLTACASTFEGPDAVRSREQALSGKCDDDSGADGRICVDDGC